MPGWVTVLIVVAVAIAAMLLKERLRVSALEKWARAKGFSVRSPFLPDEQSPAWGLAGRFTARGAKRWGAAVEGNIDGFAVTLAEFETTWAGARDPRKWQTLAFWASNATPGPIVAWPRQGVTTVDVLLPASNQRVDERLGVAGVDPDSLRLRTAGGLLVEADPIVREQWLTDERRRALEAWPAGGEFARDGAHAAWRMEGALNGELLDHMTVSLPSARRLLG